MISLESIINELEDAGSMEPGGLMSTGSNNISNQQQYNWGAYVPKDVEDEISNVLTDYKPVPFFMKYGAGRAPAWHNQYNPVNTYTDNEIVPSSTTPQGGTPLEGFLSGLGSEGGSSGQIPIGTGAEGSWMIDGSSPMSEVLTPGHTVAIGGHASGSWPIEDLPKETMSKGGSDFYWSTWETGTQGDRGMHQWSPRIENFLDEPMQSLNDIDEKLESQTFGDIPRTDTGSDPGVENDRGSLLLNTDQNISGQLDVNSPRMVTDNMGTHRQHALSRLYDGYVSFHDPLRRSYITEGWPDGDYQNYFKPAEYGQNPGYDMSGLTDVFSPGSIAKSLTEVGDKGTPFNYAPAFTKDMFKRLNADYYTPQLQNARKGLLDDYEKNLNWANQIGKGFESYGGRNRAIESSRSGYKTEMAKEMGSINTQKSEARNQVDGVLNQWREMIQ